MYCEFKGKWRKTNFYQSIQQRREDPKLIVTNTKVQKSGYRRNLTVTLHVIKITKSDVDKVQKRGPRHTSFQKIKIHVYNIR